MTNYELRIIKYVAKKNPCTVYSVGIFLDWVGVQCRRALRIFFAIAASGLNIENQQKHGRYEYEQNARHETQIINLHRKKASLGLQSNSFRISLIAV